VLGDASNDPTVDAAWKIGLLSGPQGTGGWQGLRSLRWLQPHTGDLFAEQDATTTEHGFSSSIGWPTPGGQPRCFCCPPDTRVALINVRADILECRSEGAAGSGWAAGMCQEGVRTFPDTAQLPVDRLPRLLPFGEETVEILVAQTSRVSHLMAVSAEIVKGGHRFRNFFPDRLPGPGAGRALTEFGRLPTTRATSSTVSPVTIAA